MPAEGCFQFFYASQETTLPHPDVPTRDVTDTWNAGWKTEPHLERMMENWCQCRAHFVTPQVRRALELATNGDIHVMILTTRRAVGSPGLAVGILEFSKQAYEINRAKFPDRWSDTSYLPYVGSRKSKLVSFTDAFVLKEWMSDQRKKYVPGQRYGIIRAPAGLLDQIRAHFESKADRTREFLANVGWLENRLRTQHRDNFNDYKRRKQAGKSC